MENAPAAMEASSLAALEKFAVAASRGRKRRRQRDREVSSYRKRRATAFSSRERRSAPRNSRFGEAKSKELKAKLKAKQAQLAKLKAKLAQLAAKSELDINSNLIEVGVPNSNEIGEIGKRVITEEKPNSNLINLIEVGERVITEENPPKELELIPDVEWWDVPFLRSGSYGDVVDGGIDLENIMMDKINIYIEHPLPIEPPAEAAPSPPQSQPWKLTKKEQKKLRTQRRLARENEKQEMIRLGVLEPPKPKVKMSNLMKVLGSEATQEPTKLEMEIRSAAAERQQAHIDRSIARKLTPAERREKKERKLFGDSLETIVSVYKINDLSHPQARFKVDVNAQENRLSGCAIISEGISVVVVEGGSKSIKRFGNLMLKRIDWSATVVEKDDDDDVEKPVNRCLLVWQGSVAKPNFNRFMVQECRSEAAARKFFSDHGVAHYWDLALNFTSEDAD